MGGWERAPGYGGGKPYGWQTWPAIGLIAGLLLWWFLA